jgi:hypothetical protein
MKTRISHIVALLVAVLVLAMPFGALADEGVVNVTLSNVSIKSGEIDTTIGITANAEITTDAQTYANGVVQLFSGDELAIKGGFEYDMAAQNVLMALEGATDALQINMSEAAAEMAPAADLSGLMEAANALQNVTPADETVQALGTIVQDWVAANLPEDGYKGEVELTIPDLMTEDGVIGTMTVQQYDFSLTLGDILTLVGQIANTVKDDPNMLPALQAYVDELTKLAGAEPVDLATMDIEAMLKSGDETHTADLDATFTGSVYFGENVYAIDMTVARTAGNETFVIAGDLVIGEDNTGLIQAQIDSESEYGGKSSVILHAALNSVEPLVMDATVYQTSDFKGSMLNETLINCTLDMTEGIALTVSNNNKTTFVSETSDDYVMQGAQSFSFVGNPVSTEAGEGLAGHVAFSSTDSSSTDFSLERAFGADIQIVASDQQTATFEMPINVIDMTNPSEETIMSINEEYSALLNTGLMKLMGAPGMDVIMSMFSGNIQG